MSEDLKYRVLLHEPKYKTVPITEEERNAVKGLGAAGGCALWGLLWGVLWMGITTGIAALGALLGITYKDSYKHILVYGAMASATVGASAAVALISAWLKRKNVLTLESARVYEARGAYQLDVRRATNEAASITSRLISIYKSSTDTLAELRQHLNQAALFLKHAESEYHASAFAPFWDAIESAAQHLSAFNRKANHLSRDADEYYSKLNGRKHTFPAFPVQISNIPDPLSVVKEFRRVVRMGQTNPQFANIWELRRIQEVLIAGFRTLGEAVNNLGAAIENSTYQLEQSVSSDLAKIVEEEIKTRESFDKRMGLPSLGKKQ